MKKFNCLMLLLMTIVFISSCSNDDDESKEITQTDYVLFSGETAKVQGSNLEDLEWYCSNRFVAEVGADAIIQAHRVGKTTMSSNEAHGQISVEVMPKVTNYSEPVIQNGSKWQDGRFVNENSFAQYLWGTYNTLIPHYITESGLSWTLVSQQKDIWIWQTGNITTPLVGYLFNDEGFMNATCIYLNPLYADDLADFLGERFLIYAIDKTKYTADFAYAKINNENNCDVKFIGRVGVSTSAKMIMIVYASGDNNARSEDVCLTALNKFEQAINIL